MMKKRQKGGGYQMASGSIAVRIREAMAMADIHLIQLASG